MDVNRTGAGAELLKSPLRSRGQSPGEYEEVASGAGTTRVAAVDETAGKALLRCLELRRKAQRILGEREWALLSCYGKLMGGPHSGRYVSGLACHEQLKLVRRLRSGETVPVHLMHRHKSGNYEASSLRWTPAGLVMVYDDREVQA